MNINKLFGITPGPWEVVKSGDISVYSINDMRVSDVWDKHDRRLISQAPAMLEALISCCETFEFYKDEHYKKHGVDNEKYKRNKGKYDYLCTIIESALNITWPEIKLRIGMDR